MSAFLLWLLVGIGLGSVAFDGGVTAAPSAATVQALDDGTGPPPPPPPPPPTKDQH